VSRLDQSIEQRSYFISASFVKISMLGVEHRVLGLEIGKLGVVRYLVDGRTASNLGFCASLIFSQIVAQILELSAHLAGLILFAVEDQVLVLIIQLSDLGPQITYGLLSDSGVLRRFQTSDLLLQLLLTLTGLTNDLIKTRFGDTDTLLFILLSFSGKAFGFLLLSFYFFVEDILLALFAVASLFMMSALGQGLIISTLSKNQYVASFAALLSAFLPVVLLSGFIFELNSMPFVQRAIAAVLPARYLVTCLQTLFLAGDVWPLLIPNMIKLGLLGLFFLAMTLRYTKKVLA